MGRLVGLDVGTKRFGIAVSDPLRMFASPHAVLTCTGDKQALAGIVEICRDQEAEKLVVGLPLNMDGSRGPAVERVEAFVRKLEARLSIPVVTWDERLSTKTANEALIEGNTRRAKRKELVDKVAAQVLLQHYLDAHGEPLMPDPEDA